jgi:tetraacyldisaccharide 4'-kinase
MNKLTQFFLEVWFSKRKTTWQLLLSPLSWIYMLIVLLRRFLYVCHILPSIDHNIPVIVVGNLTVGGAGKTPVVIALCELAKKMGLKPGVVSGGYGASDRSCHIIEADSTPHSSGDEPVLIARRCQIPVCVSKRRADGVAMLKEAGCNLVISDDGLQHLAMHREFEVIVIDGERQFGNKKLLPAGPLREPLSRTKKANFVLSTSDMPGVSLYQIKANDLINLKTKESILLSSFQQKKVNAIAGIGFPDKFFKSLGDAGIDPIEHRFMDHHQYEEKDLSFNNDCPVLMTEKDAVKCDEFASENLWYLPITACFDKALEDKLRSIIRGMV